MLLRLALAMCLIAMVACSPTPTNPNLERAGSNFAVRDFDFCSPQSQVPARLVRGKAPVYPVNRLMAGEDGYAVVEFDISLDGRVENLVHVDSSRSVFFTHVRVAMEDWKFDPATNDGEAVVVHCVYRQDFHVKNKTNRQRMSPP